MARKEQVAFLIEKNQKEVIDELTNEEAGIIFKAIFEYEETKKVPKLERTLKLVFKQFKGKLDSYDNAYEQKCLKNKENAMKRWNKENDTNAYDGMRMYANYANKNKIKENKIKENKINNSERENNIKERETKTIVANATPPTLETIIDYGKQLGVKKKYCERFYNYYEGIGWVTGTGQKIKNWKLIFKNWLAKDNKDIPEWFDKEHNAEIVNAEEEKEIKNMINKVSESNG